MARLAERKVLVVGAGTRPSDEPDAPVGNGRAIAVAAAREGASVAVADRDEAAARETAAMVEAEGSKAVVVIGDVADERSCEAMVEESAAKLGGLDGLVLNFVDYLKELPYFAQEVLPRLERAGVRRAVPG